MDKKALRIKESLNIYSSTCFICWWRPCGKGKSSTTEGTLSCGQEWNVELILEQVEESFSAPPGYFVRSLLHCLSAAIATLRKTQVMHTGVYMQSVSKQISLLPKPYFGNVFVCVCVSESCGPATIDSRGCFVLVSVLVWIRRAVIASRFRCMLQSFIFHPADQLPQLYPPCLKHLVFYFNLLFHTKLKRCFILFFYCLPHWLNIRVKTKSVIPSLLD